MTAKTHKSRKFTAMRLESDLVARLQRLAKAQKCSIRSIAEQAFELGLPQLENAAASKANGEGEATEAK